MNILVVDHLYHAVTRSVEFLSKPMEERHAVEVVYHNTYRSGSPPVNQDEYDANLYLQ